MRRFRVSGLAAVAGLALVTLAVASPEPRPLELVAPQETAQLGLLSSRATTSLVRLNPVSLRRSGRPVDVRGSGGLWAFSPDRRTLALALRSHPAGIVETLRFFSVSGPRALRGGIPLGGAVAALAWIRADRVLAYVDDCCGGGPSVVAVDPGARRIVTRTSIAGTTAQIARGPDSLVLVVTGTREIGGARLLLVTADGTARSANLDRIGAGLTWPDNPGGDPIGTRDIPGLAVDRAGDRAFVIATDGTVAEVGLGSLAVAYHRPTEPQSALGLLAGWLTPSAHAKGMTGPALRARWLGDGLIAVAGSDEDAAVDGDKLRISIRPLGLRIIDTRDWSVRLLDGGADSFTVADGLLLATGNSWNSEPQSESGMGVAAYGPDRARRFHLLAGRAAWIGFVYRGRAYFSLSGEARLRIVELASGRIVGVRSESSPMPLFGEPSWFFH